MANLIFISITVLIIISALGVVVSPNLVYSAVSLLFTLFGIAGLYIFLYADFLAATQVIIYVGGILVLIIFGVMLTNKIDSPSVASSSSNQVVGTICSSLIFLFQLGVIFKTDWPNEGIPIENGGTAVIGRMLLTEYLLPFEVVSVLLLGALIGASMLSRKN